MMKNNNLIGKKCDVGFYFSDGINFSGEIVGYNPATGFWKSSSSVDILKEDGKIEDNIGLYLVKIKNEKQ